MRFCTIILVASMLATPLGAQRPNTTAAAADRDTTAKATPIPNEASSATDHTIRFGGQLVPYRATAATMLLKNDKDESIGVLYYTAYTRTEASGEGDRQGFLGRGRRREVARPVHLAVRKPQRPLGLTQVSDR